MTQTQKAENTWCMLCLGFVCNVCCIVYAFYAPLTNLSHFELLMLKPEGSGHQYMTQTLLTGRLIIVRCTSGLSLSAHDFRYEWALSALLKIFVKLSGQLDDADASVTLSLSLTPSWNHRACARTRKSIRAT